MGQWRQMEAHYPALSPDKIRGGYQEDEAVRGGEKDEQETQ